MKSSERKSLLTMILLMGQFVKRLPVKSPERKSFLMMSLLAR